MPWSHSRPLWSSLHILSYNSYRLMDSVLYWHPFYAEVSHANFRMHFTLLKIWNPKPQTQLSIWHRKMLRQFHKQVWIFLQMNGNYSALRHRGVIYVFWLQWEPLCQITFGHPSYLICRILELGQGSSNWNEAKNRERFRCKVRWRPDLCSHKISAASQLK